MREKFSVLLSLYAKERPAYLRAALDSLLAQTLLADEWVIVEDGPLTPELYAVLAEFETARPGLIRRVPLAENQGLGLALRAGVPECSYERIARMDTDDICLPDRFEKQMAQMDADPGLDVCGGQIDEFEDTPDKIVASRRVPLTDAEIKAYQKKRDGFNHVSVMFKKSAVLRAGNYQSAPLMEDTLLWCHMILAGAKCANLPDVLVWVRIGKDMYERRGGWAYFKKYREGRRAVRKTGYISAWDYGVSIAAQFVVALIPGGLRAFVFKKILHR